MMVDPDFFIFRANPEGFGRANIHTGVTTALAGIAALGRKRYARSGGYPLGIMAPHAGKRTAFKKDGGADAGAILAAIPFNVKNKPFWFSRHHICSCETTFGKQ